MTRPASYAPIVLAVGVMLALWGVASTWIVSAIVLLPLSRPSALALAKEARHEK